MRPAVHLISVAGIYCWATALSGASYVPESVQLQVDDINKQFVQVLEADCGSDVCYGRGCVPVKHRTVLDKSRYLAPGISTVKPEAVPKQYRLMEARCSFAHEDTMASADLANLKRRLVAKLSSEGVRVSMQASKLPPKLVPPESPLVETPLEMQAWQELKPHLFWMVGLLLATLCIMAVVWALRRPVQDPPEELDEDDEATSSTQPGAVAATGASAASEVQKARGRLLDQIENEPKIWDNITTGWLLGEEFGTLASAVRYLGDDLRIVPQSKHLLPQRLRFHSYLNRQEATMPEADFYKTTAACWQAYQQLDDDTVSVEQVLHLFSPYGLAEELQAMPPYLAKVAMSFVERYELPEVCEFMKTSSKVEILREVLHSDRASLQDLEETLNWLKAVLKGEDGRQGAKLASERSHQGVKLYVHDVAAILLDSLPAIDKRGVLAQLRDQPAKDYWQGIFYPEMLGRLSDDMLAQAIVDQNADALVSWLRSVKDQALRRRILSLAPKMVQELAQAGSAMGAVGHRSREEVDRGFAAFLSRRSANGEVDFVSLL